MHRQYHRHRKGEINLVFYDKCLEESIAIEPKEYIVIYLLERVSYTETANNTINFNVEIMGSYPTFEKAYKHMEIIGNTTYKLNHKKVEKDTPKEITYREDKVEYQYLGDRYIITRLMHHRDQEAENAVMNELVNNKDFD